MSKFIGADASARHRQTLAQMYQATAGWLLRASRLGRSHRKLEQGDVKAVWVGVLGVVGVVYAA